MYIFFYIVIISIISFSFTKTIVIKYPKSIAIALLLVLFPNPLAAGSGFKVRWGPCLLFYQLMRKLKQELTKILLEIFGYLDIVAEKHCLKWNDIFNWLCNWSIVWTYIIFVKKNTRPNLFRQKNYAQNAWFTTIANLQQKRDNGLKWD